MTQRRFTFDPDTLTDALALLPPPERAGQVIYGNLTLAGLRAPVAVEFRSVRVPYGQRVMLVWERVT